LKTNVSDAALKASASRRGCSRRDHIRLIAGPAPSPDGPRRIESRSPFVDRAKLNTLYATTNPSLKKFGATHAKS
jgi:hypothetical protein